MKKVLFTTLVLCICFTVSAYANPIDRQTAEQKAAQFFQKKTPGKALKSFQSIELSVVEMNTAWEASLHIFNRGMNEGWVVVSGEDAMDNVILAWRDKGSFDEKTIPDAMHDVLRGYRKGIERLRSLRQGSQINEKSIGNLPKSVAKIMGASGK